MGFRLKLRGDKLGRLRFNGFENAPLLQTVATKGRRGDAADGVRVCCGVGEEPNCRGHAWMATRQPIDNTLEFDRPTYRTEYGAIPR